MSITGFFRKTVDTKRLSSAGGSSNRQVWSDNLSDLSCAIHPMNPEKNLVNSAFYKTYKMFCASGTDIKEGDQVIDGSTVYTVQGVSDYDDMGGVANEHMRIIMVKGD